MSGWDPIGNQQAIQHLTLNYSWATPLAKFVFHHCAEISDTLNKILNK